MKLPCVYIMTNRRDGTLYTGVSSDLPRRAYLHRSGALKGFTKKYGCKLLVWFEMHATMPDAIRREKQIKAGQSLEEAGADREAESRLERSLRVFDMNSSLRGGEADEAIQGPQRKTGLLRFARNDEEG